MRGKLVQYPDHVACAWRPPGAEGRHCSPGARAGWEKRGDMGTERQSGASGHTQNLHTVVKAQGGKSHTINPQNTHKQETDMVL